MKKSITITDKKNRISRDKPHLATNTDLIEREIRSERISQDLKFGKQNHEPFKWLAILGEEVGEVNKAVIDMYNFNLENFSDSDAKDYEHLRMELIQVAAVAKAFIECLDRNTWER